MCNVRKLWKIVQISEVFNVKAGIKVELLHIVFTLTDYLSNHFSFIPTYIKLLVRTYFTLPTSLDMQIIV